ncbi:MAG: GspH/FimT family protein [Sulfuricaulis sp.]
MFKTDPPAVIGARRGRGFTLIEIVVVMFIIVIILGIVSANLEPNPQNQVRDEANRLALLLQTAQQEAILQGKILAVTFERRGYSFLVLDSANKFQPLTQDEILYPRPLPAHIVIASVDIDGAPETGTPRLLLLPSGELPAFTVTLGLGDARWQVKGGALTGGITAQSAAEPGNA